MSKRAFTATLVKTVIEKVKQRPEIWKLSHPLHRRRYVHEQFWKDMAIELGINERVLKKRWKHMKDQYRKELKKAIEKDAEDSVCWQYFNMLGFLKEDIVHRDRERAVAAAIDADDSSAEEAETPEENNESKTLKKVRNIKKKSDDSMKLNAILQRLTQTKRLLEKKTKEQETRNEDPDYMFLVSLLPSIKQLSDVHKLQLRGKINSWLLEALAVKEYTNVCHSNEDGDNYVPMEIIKYEAD